MIFKSFVLEFMVCVGCLHEVSGASYSKVYVQGGQNGIPVTYVPYGAPAVAISGQKIAQISAAPVETAVPVSSSPNFLIPCGSPCIYTGSAISSTQQIVSATPNFVPYKSNTPVVQANNEEPRGYEYSYVVYDENTRDHKAQYESSDGGVVRGQYSLIQPDGFVREVHYTADDINGFNAIVKKFLPVNVEAKSQHGDDNPALPCQSLTSSSDNKKQEEADQIETEGEHQETTTTVASNVNLGEKLSGQNDEHNPTLTHESNEEDQLDITREALSKPSEALTKASSETSEEKDSSEEMTEPHQGAETHGEHDIQHAISNTARLEALEGPSYRSIIKCFQNAKNSKEQILAHLTLCIPEQSVLNYRITY